ncbi:BlaI/MecI/CopY family transcriptional regulator [Knoellia subterranea]|uniref:Transcriptional regulator n=1 Tax=Knoellia subterranea KCTC 19937 TaxID=1385521 RepID=A0A0A0JIE2_9MICO|nr:BlaI/MecI/CopY family transcriptional regulator [Knoellia subterranea]KGN37165.1 transcriptional regulator [Knoellia subterranea KCTC 19937]
MSPNASAPRLGDLERAVMEQLWASEEPAGMSVREVLAGLPAERELAYTTVMTVLDRLAKKELVTRERDGRAWRYLPAGTRESLTAETMRASLGNTTDRKAALLHFLDGATPEELDDLRAALAEVEQKRG